MTEAEKLAHKIVTALQTTHRVLAWSVIAPFLQRLIEERDDLRRQLALSTRPHSFVELTWVCGHKGGAACIQCFEAATKERDDLRQQLDEALCNAESSTCPHCGLTGAPA